MKQVMKAVKTLAFALGIGAAVHATAADIAEVRPCDASGNAITYEKSKSDPYLNGEDFYFILRLYNPAAGSGWGLQHVGLNSETLDLAYLPELGIYVSGELRRAKMAGLPAMKGSYFTDILFTYKVMPGDFANPVRLATVTDTGTVMPGGFSGQGSKLMLYGTDRWQLKDADGNVADLAFITDDTRTMIMNQWLPDDEIDAPLQSMQFLDPATGTGFFVKSVDFNQTWEVSPTESDAGCWREVHEKAARMELKSGSATVQLVALPTATIGTNRMFYVWSDNEAAVKVYGATAARTRTVEIELDDSGVKTPVSVATVVIEANADPANTGLFEIRGIAEGGTANLYMSPWADGFKYDTSGEKMTDDILTVPVRCIYPKPPTLSVTSSTETLYATSTPANQAATLTVAIDQTYPADLSVTLNAPEFTDASTTEPWSSYMRFSTKANTLPTTADTVTVTIPAGSLVATDSIYVYALRSDEHTIGADHTIKLSVAITGVSSGTVADAEAIFDPADNESALVNIETVDAATSGEDNASATPRIDSWTGSSESTPFYTTNGEENAAPMTIVVSDTYADETDRAAGYTIFYKRSSKDKTWTQIAGVYGVGARGVLYKLDTETGTLSSELPEIWYPSASENAYVSQFYIVSPVSGNQSEIKTFYALIDAASTVSITTTDGQTTFSEGDEMEFNIELSEPNIEGKTIYAFLKAGSNAKAAMFDADFVVCEDTDPTETIGIPIGKNQYTVDESLSLLEGTGGKGLKLQFEVVLCYSQQYDETKLVPGYDPANYLNIRVTNVEPVVTRVEMDGFEAEFDGYTFPNQYPRGETEHVFKAVITDAGSSKSYDLVADGNDAFYVKWTTWFGDQRIETKELRGNPNTSSDTEYRVKFVQAGTYRIVLQYKDKDMDDWAETTYTVSAVAISSPAITVTAPRMLDENAATPGTVDVSLGYYDPLLSEPLAVRVTIANTRTTETAGKGCLRLEASSTVIESSEEDASGTPIYYYDFTVSNAGTISLPIDPDTLDGARNARFAVTAQVLSTTTLPTSGEPANEYYAAGAASVTVANVEPETRVSPLPNESTNRWTTVRTITWYIDDDVNGDIAKGFTIKWSGCDNAADGSKTVSSLSSESFTPQFNSSGDVDLLLTISDADGGSVFYEWHFTIPPEKTLVTTAVGPSGGSLSLSSRYTSQKGIGQGHVWTTANYNRAENFSLYWNAGSAHEVPLYAWGYKVGDVDNGQLNAAGSVRRDWPVNAYGYGSKDTPDLATGFVYADKNRDSYLYAYVAKSAGDDGAAGSIALLGSTIWPEGSALRTPYVDLPTSAGEDGVYGQTIVDAIFSKEWRPLDNCGDINQDGIPDRSLLDYNFGITFDGTADIANLADANADNDFLPFNEISGNGFNPGIADSWANEGGAFNAYYEVRGFGLGLNAGYLNPDGSTPDVDYTPYEMAAYMEWKGLKTTAELKNMTVAAITNLFYSGISVTDDEGTVISTTDVLALATEDLAAFNAGEGGWSPERPTDPVKADTDGDSLPDGYEYWIWYGAHVGYPNEEGGKWQGRITGKRLNLDDLESPEEISSDAIAEAYDPLVNGGRITRDTDNDGLTDYEEYLIGTSPFNCDTDGDGMADGWELTFGLNPLSYPNGEVNPDNDYMAYAQNLIQFAGNYMIPGACVVIIPVNEATTNYYLTADYDVYSARYGFGTRPKTFMGALLPSHSSLNACFRTFNGDKIPATSYSLDSDNNALKPVEVILPEDAEIAYDDSIRLVHEQVYWFLGFDPRTAVSIMNNGSGSHVTARWRVNDPINKGGLHTHTKAFTSRDEYLLYKYTGGANLRKASKNNTVLLRLYNGTTNPNVPFSGKTYGNSSNAYAQTIHGADTDADGVPDGWELYTDFNPVIPYGSKNPLEGRYDAVEHNDHFADGLDLAAEYAGSDSSYAYSGVDTIYSHLPGARTGWWNKFLPTDPRNGDTDGDGVLDGTEGGSMFIYGSITDDHSSFCFRGGGMNPGSSDTDSDGLPDGWERQFAGTRLNADGSLYDPRENFVYTDELKIADGFPSLTVSANGPYIAGGMDASDAFDACTAVNSKHPGTGTVRDFDFDRDGLENFQEYLTQAVRCWRYDDVETPLMGRAIIWTGAAATTSLSAAPTNNTDFIVHNYFYAADMFKAVTNSAIAANFVTDENLYYKDSETTTTYWTLEGVFDDEGNPVIVDGVQVSNLVEHVGTAIKRFAPAEYDFKALGYFAPCDSIWDVWGVQHSTGYMRRPSTMALFEAGVGPRRIPANEYVSTSPVSSDTDNDGMDDYWEVYHGLNPLYGGAGGSDVISGKYKAGNIISATANVWTGVVNADADSISSMEKMDETASLDAINIARPEIPTAYPLLAFSGLDLVRAPWLAGGSEVDADGDGIRNFNESITGNMTSPGTLHTDPSPLWMTDVSSGMSYASQYYSYQGIIQAYPFYARYVDTKLNPNTNGTLDGVDLQYMFSFEENEGYDTDGDFRGDGHEIVKAVMPKSDPLDATDPARRAALYLNGQTATDEDPGVVVSYDTRMLGKNFHAIEDGADIFHQFTVELWTKPEEFGEDRTLIERGAEYPASTLVNSNRQWRANFRIGIDPNGYAYGLFDSDDAVVSGGTSVFSTQKVVGPILELGAWTHLALSFDGSTLRIYVNGVEYSSSSSDTELLPANGVLVVRQNAASTQTYPYGGYTVAPSMTIIGARRNSATFYWNEAQLLAALLEEAGVTETGTGDESGETTPVIDPEELAAYGFFNQFTNYFKGYISEVRVWDGARSASEIAGSYAKAFTVEDIEKNRLEVYGEWGEETAHGTRNDMDGNPTLSPQLMLHYNFSQLPAAYDADGVALQPSGFDLGVLDNCLVDDAAGNKVVPEGAKVGWWDATPMKSTVYTSPYVLPWIKNTVSHLAPFDEGMSDSMYWNQRFAGYNSAAGHGVTSYGIPNSGNPYAGSRYGVDSMFRWWRLTHQGTAAATEFAKRRHFELRSSFIYGSDLIPLGSAFAKYDADFWDGQGASTAWTDTSLDSDGDDLPDWWEQFVLDGGDSDVVYSDLPDELSPGATLKRNGVLMTVAQAYTRDLAKGYLLTGAGEDGYTIEKLSDYVDKRDTDANGLPDWWAALYGVKGGPSDDDDNDGLSNYMEYLLSEVFKFEDTAVDGTRVRIAFSPVDPYSVDMVKYGLRYNTDYFYKVGDLYIGEIFSDHDMIEDGWEDGFAANYASRYKWNGLKTDDRDVDGWSVFAEARYNQFTSSILADLVSHTTVGYEKKDMPRPVLEIDIAYNGNLNLNVNASSSTSSTSTSTSGNTTTVSNTVETTTVIDANSWVPVVVNVYSRPGQAEPDASYRITPGEQITAEKILGNWADRVIRGTLTPGYIEYSSLELQSMQVSSVDHYTWYVYTDSYVGSGEVIMEGDGFIMATGSYDDFYSDYLTYGRMNVSETGTDFNWGRIDGFTLKNDANGKVAYICINGIQYGQVNLVTGEFDVDIGKIATYWAGFISQTTGVPVTTENSAFRFVYTSHVPVLQARHLQLFLGEPQGAGNTGYVREGLNRVEAYFDIDGNGYYTEGEPYGVVDGVDVGWYRGKTSLELTDYGPTTRVNLFNDSSDTLDTVANAITSVRNVTVDGVKNIVAQRQDDAKQLANGSSERRVRVVRYAVNGYPVYQAGVAAKTILDKSYGLLTHPVITEADFMADGEFDIEWNDFYDEVANNGTMIRLAGNVTNITYLVVTGDGPTGFKDQNDTNTVYALMSTIVRKFDATSARPRPVLYAPGAQESEVFGSRPAFKWTMANSGYPAFRIQVSTDTDFTSGLVWDSGVRRAPAPVLGNDNQYHYEYEPDLYVGDLLDEVRNYYWRVSMYNSKFKDVDLWSTNYPAFRMDAVADNYKYGSIKIAAKYFGPKSVLDAGVVRVEAYETPDFTGMPVARTFVRAADVESVAAEGAAHTVNATLIGLPAGDYYVRAYIDLDEYGDAYVKDDTESWGYVSKRDGTTADMFMPTTIQIGSTIGSGETFTLYIEDVDTNGNNLPDAWEVVKNGGELDAGTVRIEDDGVLTIADDVLEAIETTNESVQGLAAYTFSIMKNAGVALLATGNGDNVDANSTAYAEAVVAGSSGTSTEVSASEPVVKAIATADGKVVITATTKASLSEVDSSGNPVNVVAKKNWVGAGSGQTTAKKLRGRVIYSTDLKKPVEDWTKSDVLVEVTVTADGQIVTGEFDVSSLCEGEEQCFFKVAFE